ncbi:UDP-N-acetylglucosamine pyrophosphorylase [Aestuariimicrobium sp. p3-SID1156]|uniref:UDP-N-acetylglucosamine pyrophosphorylase n=1 Tax=Aestuariimicrobium sp. p3-SID1156 TaxID=2916038 RepID=UPI00223C036B|nr:UDP-N-acetylglucosamine pyrophosphorylase [Aestuariimicrobium sp. p3-SID1156]MCT1458474.1 UDP-N-acetylglucosamine pyrophosphorylase [Aestuariimicrobium sp. p3-SID1156]
MQEPRGFDKAQALIDKGVSIPNPWTIDIADDVTVDRISGEGVVLHPGTRLRGAKTVISAGCILGAEGPVTVENCWLGPRVELKGGYFSTSVFLAGSSMTLGAHVREGSILEEEASGAHTVGLKQTILFPYVTLGSLINFCDVMMAGGSSRKDHSEVGSSYIHFNFTPDGDKTTASLFGDVPRGVLLDQKPIFLGGQGGSVGPVTTGFGVVVGAGSILREDVEDDDVLLVPEVVSGLRRPNKRHSYRKLNSLLEKNLTYIASLVALENWYRQVRALFFAQQEFGREVLDGALEQLASGQNERLKRLKALVSKLQPSDEGRQQLIDNCQAMLDGCVGVRVEAPAEVITALQQRADAGDDYLTAIHGLSDAEKQLVTGWLDEVIAIVRRRSAEAVPALGLFSA